MLVATCAGSATSILKGSGDINGDGTDDIIWQNTSGQVLYWRMQNGQVAAGGGNIAGPVATQWTLSGVGNVEGLTEVRPN